MDMVGSRSARRAAGASLIFPAERKHQQGVDVSDSDSKPRDAETSGSSEDNWRPSAASSEPSSGQAVPPAAGEVSPADAGQPKEPKSAEALRAELEQAQAEATKLREQLLRTAADFDNFRKRTRRDLEEAQRKSVERVLVEVLPVGDNLERAVQAAQKGGDASSVVEGITMVLRFFEDALNRLGVERVPSLGQPFDPGLHEAVQQVESEQPAGTVVNEMVPGYRLQGKLLRPAMVAVARKPVNN
ncbi:MAG: Heat shock protein GrpE [Myxococcaceae bacterium]|nr:Heat shock protein GrpE [Myxococcaceae bacterium]